MNIKPRAISDTLDGMEADGLITQGRVLTDGPPPFDALWGDSVLWADDHIVTNVCPPEPEGSAGQGIVYALPVAVLLWIVVGTLAWAVLR